MIAEERIEQPAELLPRRMNPLIILLTMGLALLVVFGFGMALLRANLTQLQSGIAPDFTVKQYSSPTTSDFTLSKFRGHVVLINFWASWCDSCRDEAVDLNTIWDEYKDRGVIFIGISHVDDDKHALAFLNEYHIPYPTGPDNGTSIYDAYRVGGLPETYIVDKNGNLAKTIIGAVNAADVRPILDKLLAG